MRKVIVAIALAISGAVCSAAFSAVFSAPAVYAASDFAPVCDDPDVDDELKELSGCKTRTEGQYGNIVQTLINVVISVIGIVAVAVIIMAGQRYMTSNGDPGKTKQAKDMLMWGVIGLAITILAGVIVNFVIAALK